MLRAHFWYPFPLLRVLRYYRYPVLPFLDFGWFFKENLEITRDSLSFLILKSLQNTEKTPQLLSTQKYQKLWGN